MEVAAPLQCLMCPGSLPQSPPLPKLSRMSRLTLGLLLHMRLPGIPFHSLWSLILRSQSMVHKCVREAAWRSRGPVGWEVICGGPDTFIPSETPRV